MTRALPPLCTLTLLLALSAGELSADGVFVRRARKVEQERKQRVLFLGDSMSFGEFGRSFDARLRDNGFEVYTYVAGGATPYYWLSRYKPIASDIGFWTRTPQVDSRKRYIKAVPKVENLLKSHDPDTVVVQTGINLYATLRSKRRSKADNVREVENLCRDMAAAVAAGGRRLFWVTPPKSHIERYPAELQAEMAQIMKRAVAPYGRVFDSRAVTTFVDPYPETDGIHYGPTEARMWANRVADAFLAFSGDSVAVRRALEPNEPFEGEVPTVKKAIPVEPGEVEWGEIDVTLRLKAKSELPKLSEVTYQSCTVLYEYEVLRVNGGFYPYDTLRVAHIGMHRREFTAKARYPIGTVRSWRMVPIETYAYFLRLQMADGLEPDLDRPIYVIRQD